jgi:glutamate dehydrogenase
MAAPGSALIDAIGELVRERVGDDRAEDVERFARQYYRWAPPEDVGERAPLDLYGAALAHIALGRRRPPGATRVRAYNPDFDQDGWQSTHTAIQVISDDMPFLVDSVGMELGRLGAGIHLLIHPVVRVVRDGDGQLAAVLEPGAASAEGEVVESYLHVEVDRRGDPAELAFLVERVEHVLQLVRAAVEDWPAMRDRMRGLIAELEQPPAGTDPDEVEEARALLSWLEDRHFTFLGFREYELLEEDGEDVLRPVPGSGWASCARPVPPSGAFARLPPRVRALAREPRALVLTKANARSPIHRPAYLDYVGVKRFGPDGEVVGERRFLGLYTTAAYRTLPQDIPGVRRKRAAVLARASFPPGGHDEKALAEILDTFPRDELFQIAEDELFDIAIGILHLGERQRVRLFMRPDRYERFVSCLVFLPRDRFHTQIRERIQEMLGRSSTGRAWTSSCACRSPCSCASTSSCGCAPGRARRATSRRSSGGSPPPPGRGPTTCTTCSSRTRARSPAWRSRAATATRSPPAIASTGPRARRSRTCARSRRSPGTTSPSASTAPPRPPRGRCAARSSPAVSA